MNGSADDRDLSGRERNLWWTVIPLGVAVVVMWIFAVPTFRYCFPPETEPNIVGEAFAAVESLFSGLAFLGVIAAVLLQRVELGLQREELKATRAELKRSAAAQEQAASQLDRQAKMMIAAARIGAIQGLLSSANSSREALASRNRQEIPGDRDRRIQLEARLQVELDALG